MAEHFDKSDDPRALEAEVLIDPRLADVWPLLWARPEDGWSEAIASAMRLAYFRGYHDALSEPRGELLVALGVRVPRARRRPAGPTVRASAPRGSSDT